jgi:molybdate transport system regulatory protein
LFLAKGTPDHELTLRITLSGGKRLGPGKIKLLEEIGARGSISAAGRAMNMSYKRAWDLVAEANSLFGTDVVESKTGGRQGGGAQLTTFGKHLVKDYREAHAKADMAVMAALRKLRTASKRSG